MLRGLADWHFVCACRNEASRLSPRINVIQTINEDTREMGLRSVRMDSFAAVIDVLREGGLKSGRVLDVGSAHGWFLDTLETHGFEAIGIEPDIGVVKGRGNVRVGFFPDVLGADERFDAITFNDVLEHLTDPALMIRRSAEYLHPGGLLVVNGPESTGALYRVARAMRRVGIVGPFERMWQKDFPSPHLSYFTAEGLRRMANAAGLEHVGSRRVNSISRDGLWARIAYAKVSYPIALGTFVALSVGKSLLDLLPSDTTAHVFRKSVRH